MGTVTEAGDRIAWVDAARGVGIVAVVAGHVVAERSVKQTIFLFHMPFFFFLSGLVYRTPASLPAYVRRRARSLLVPYASFLVAVTAADLLWSRQDGIVSLTPSIKNGVRLLLGGSFLSGAQTVFWFAPCLFWTVTLYAWGSRLLGGPKQRAMLIAIAALYVLSACLPAHLATPLGIGQVPIALVFFWIGAVFSELELRMGFLAGGLALFILSVGWAPPIDMKQLILGIPIVSVAVAFAGTLGLVFVVRVAIRLPVIAKAAALLGRASLTIMFLHVLIVMHLRGLFPESVVFVAALLLPVLVYLIFDRFEATRAIFLGSARRKVR